MTIVDEFDFRTMGIRAALAFVANEITRQNGSGASTLASQVSTLAPGSNTVTQAGAGLAGPNSESTSLGIAGQGIRCDALLSVMAEITGNRLVVGSPGARFVPVGPDSPKPIGDDAHTAVARGRLSRHMLSTDFPVSTSSMREVVAALQQACTNVLIAGRPVNVFFVEPVSSTELAEEVIDDERRARLPMAIGPVPLGELFDLVAHTTRCEWMADENVIVFRSTTEPPRQPDVRHRNALLYLGMRALARDEAVTAWQYLRKAAEAGHPHAQYLLGCAILEGHGESGEGVKDAVIWWRRSAAEGNQAAKARLAECYLRGTGHLRDEAKGVTMLREMVDEGNNEARFLLGSYVTEERAQTPVKALLLGARLLAAAADEGHEGAVRRLREVTEAFSADAHAVFAENTTVHARFASDASLAGIARSVSGMKFSVSFPNESDCDQLLDACDSYLSQRSDMLSPSEGQADSQWRIVRAVFGARLLFANEQTMIRRGFERRDGVWYNPDQLDEARLRDQEEQWLRQSAAQLNPAADSLAGGRLVGRVLGDEKKAQLEIDKMKRKAPQFRYEAYEVKNLTWHVYALPLETKRTAPPELVRRFDWTPLAYKSAVAEADASTSASAEHRFVVLFDQPAGQWGIYRVPRDQRTQHVGYVRHPSETRR